MKPHVSPVPQDAAAHEPGPEPVVYRSYQATDLTTDPARRDHWRPGGQADAPPEGLPADGLASPMGYWLAAVAEAPPGPLRLTVRAPKAGALAIAAESAGPRRRGRPPRTVRLNAQAHGGGDLILTVGPDGAAVTCGEATWKAAGEGVLLAVCQYWRFRAVEAELDRLTELARGDVGHAAMAGGSSFLQRRRLVATARDFRALQIDLAHFEGPLTDPHPYAPTDRAAQVYEALAEKLGLEEWCELIDERCEAVEDTYEAATEKLFEFKNFAAEAVLEVLIIVILLGELGLMLWENFGPGI